MHLQSKRKKKKLFRFLNNKRWWERSNGWRKKLYSSWDIFRVLYEYILNAATRKCWRYFVKEDDRIERETKRREEGEKEKMNFMCRLSCFADFFSFFMIFVSSFFLFLSFTFEISQISYIFFVFCLSLNFYKLFLSFFLCQNASFSPSLIFGFSFFFLFRLNFLTKKIILFFFNYCRCLLSFTSPRYVEFLYWAMLHVRKEAFIEAFIQQFYRAQYKQLCVFLMMIDIK